MANLRQVRVPDQTLSQGFVPESHGSAIAGQVPATDRNPSTRPFVLSVRLGTPDSANSQGGVSWNSHSPAAALILDLITASGGASEPAQGTTLSARYFNVQSALLTTRRLQSALQGLAEHESFRNTAVAILIHSVDDPVRDSAPGALERAAPGQVLLSTSIAESFQQLPNLTLSQTADAGWHDLQWRGPDVVSNYVADEQSTLRLIRELGREDPCAPIAETPAFTPAPPSPTTQTSAAFAQPAGLGRAGGDRDAPPADNKKKWLIFGGAAAAACVAVVLIVVIVIPAVSGNRRNPAAQPAETTTKTTGPITPTNPSPDNGKPNPGKTSQKQPNPSSPHSSKQPKTDLIPDQKPEQSKPVAGICDLTEAEIPRTLDRAEKNMYAGKLDDALAAYQRVLGCPSAHEKALEGLQRVKQRIAAQSP